MSPLMDEPIWIQPAITVAIDELDYRPIGHRLKCGGQLVRAEAELGGQRFAAAQEGNPTQLEQRIWPLWLPPEANDLDCQPEGGAFLIR
jgi:hypothetical protein